MGGPDSIQDSDPSRPRPSGTPGGGCNPRNGVIRVTSPENASGGRPSLDGFLSLVGNEFGEYGYTADRGNALRVILNDCDGTPFNLLSTVSIECPEVCAVFLRRSVQNGFRDFPFVGGIKGFSSTSSNLSPGSYNYAYIGGTTQSRSCHDWVFERHSDSASCSQRDAAERSKCILRGHRHSGE